jgi:hypothetical protein
MPSLLVLVLVVNLSAAPVESLDAPVREVAAPVLALDTPTRDASADVKVAPAPNLWLPLVEISLYNVLLSAFNAAVFREPWTRVTWLTLTTNLRGGWQFDGDDFEINNVGHPYQGAQPFQAARSSGFGFWPSMGAAVLSSVIWEIGGEALPPSINDQITTGFGGAFLGEALRRAGLALMEWPSDLSPWARLFGRILLDPSGSFNAWVTDGRYDVHGSPNPPVHLRLSAGMNALGRVTTEGSSSHTDLVLGEELHVSARLQSGLLVSRTFRPRQPFDQFDLLAELSISKQPYATLMVSGLLFGDRTLVGASGAFVWGLFGSYDFANPPALRVATVAAGPGAVFAVALAERYELQGSLSASLVGWGAAGALPRQDGLARDYHIGPGFQAASEVQLVHRRVGAVRAAARQYVITGAYDEPGTELITYLTFGASVAMGAQWELSVDGVVSARNTDYRGVAPDAHQRSTQVRAALTWRSEAGHGATRLEP